MARVRRPRQAPRGGQRCQRPGVGRLVLVTGRARGVGPPPQRSVAEVDAGTGGHADGDPRECYEQPHPRGHARE